MIRYLTHLGGPEFTVALPLLLMLPHGTRDLGLMMLGANASSHVVVQVLKRLVARPRPCDATGRSLALIDLPDPFSFPSGHAAAAAALAIPAAMTHPWIAPLAIPLAGAVASTRIVLRVHHVSDVIAGLVLGGAAGVLVQAL
jgi:undecaprenyl-diphosphatase